MADDDDEEEITTDTLRCKPRAPPISAQSAFSYIPPRRQDPKEHSYYYRENKVRLGEAAGWGLGRGLGEGRSGPDRRDQGPGRSAREGAWGQ